MTGHSYGELSAHQITFAKMNLALGGTLVEAAHLIGSTSRELDLALWHQFGQRKVLEFPRNRARVVPMSKGPNDG